MDILLMAALCAVTVLLAYYCVILHERITVLTEEIDDAEKQLADAAAGADRLNARVDQFVKTLALMVAEMDALEKRNHALEKRSGRNAPSMRSGVYGHRGHGA